MRKLIVLISFATLSACFVQAQTTPPGKTRADGAFTQIDYYLTALKRLGIPTSNADALDGNVASANTAKIIWNTSLNKLRVYDGTVWRDAIEADLSPYYTKAQIDSLLVDRGLEKVSKSGDTMTGRLTMDGSDILIKAPAQTTGNEVSINTSLVEFNNTLANKKLYLSTGSALSGYANSDRSQGIVIPFKATSTDRLDTLAFTSDIRNSDTSVVHKAGKERITGQKVFNASSTTPLLIGNDRPTYPRVEITPNEVRALTAADNSISLNYGELEFKRGPGRMLFRTGTLDAIRFVDLQDTSGVVALLHDVAKKADDADVIHKTGNESFTGNKTGQRITLDSLLFNKTEDTYNKSLFFGGLKTTLGQNMQHFKWQWGSNGLVPVTRRSLSLYSQFPNTADTTWKLTARFDGVTSYFPYASIGNAFADSLVIRPNGGIINSSFTNPDYTKLIIPDSLGVDTIAVRSDMPKMFTYTTSGDGVTKEFRVPHGLGYIPTMVIVQGNSEDAYAVVRTGPQQGATSIGYIDGNDVVIKASSPSSVSDAAFPLGTNNLTWTILVK